jgi:hypothetical protein
MTNTTTSTIEKTKANTKKPQDQKAAQAKKPQAQKAAHAKKPQAQKADQAKKPQAQKAAQAKKPQAQKPQAQKAAQIETQKAKQPVSENFIRKVQKESLSKSHNQSEKPARKNSNNQRADGFIELGKTPRSQLYAVRKLPIINKIIFSNLNQFTIIGHNTAAITGGLLRYRAFEGVAPFEEYVKNVVNNVNKSILAEIDECIGYLAQYQTQGYEFYNESDPSICSVKLFNSASNQLIDMYLYLDTLMTHFNYLEKCGHITSSEKINLERQWSMLPRELNSKILSVRAAIEKQLKINIKQQNRDNKVIDPVAITKLFSDFQASRAEISLTHIKPIPEMKNNLEITDANEQKLA